jgi:hypothetical protein
MAEFGLVAWVYRLDRNDSLVVDWDLSRRMAREIAAAYRAPVQGTPQHLTPLRAEAAAALEAFADERCTMLEPRPGVGAQHAAPAGAVPEPPLLSLHHPP